MITAEVFVKAVPLSCGAVSGKGKIGYGVTANAGTGSGRDGEVVLEDEVMILGGPEQGGTLLRGVVVAPSQVGALKSPRTRRGWEPAFCTAS